MVISIFQEKCMEENHKALSATSQEKLKEDSVSQVITSVSEIIDIAGNLTPITAAIKLDLHILVLRK